MHQTMPCVLITTPQNLVDDYCVYEVVNIDAVMKKIYIGMTRLADVYRMPDLQKNALYFTLVTQSTRLQVTVVATGDQITIYNEWARRVKAEPTEPVCNSIVQRMTTTKRTAIRCRETGMVFKSAVEACQTMQLSASQLSQHLKGRADHVKNFTFERIAV